MEQTVERPKTKTPASIPPPSAPQVDVGAALGLDAAGKARRPRRLWPYVAGVLIAVLGAGLYLWFSQPEQVVRFAAQPVERGDMIVEISATGTLQPLTQVEVSSELSGVMRSVMVDENQRVAKGDVLAQLDTTRIAAQVERAEANVKAAAARVTDAAVTVKETERALQRSSQLADRNLVANQALETAEAARDRAASALETAEANLAVAEADLKLQEAELAKSTIYAPIDGIVLTRSVNPGQTVAASTSAPVLFVIAENLETMQLNAAIDEADIGQVEKDQRARFTVDAFPARRFDASIRDIAFASVTTEGVVTYQARLSVDNAELLLRPGMTATVNVVTREANDVLLVPTAAFRFTPPAPEAQRSFSIRDVFMPRFGGPRGMRGGRPAGGGGDGGRALYVLEDGQPVRRTVEVGASSGEMTEIVSGLAEGDRVVTGIMRSTPRSR